MKEALKNRWIKALSSGKYPKGRMALVRDKKYCCLGVLCAISGKTDRQIQNIRTYGETSQRNGLLSKRLLNTFGLTSKDQNTLAGLNDRSRNFKPVIKRIEKLL